MIHHAVPFANILATAPVAHAAPRGMRVAVRRIRRAVARLEHVFVGGWRLPPPAAQVVASLLHGVARLTRRVAVAEWARFRIDVGRVAAAGNVMLLPITDQVARRLSTHPDATHPAVASAMAFPAQGLRQGLVWMEQDEPLCMQWLFTADDNAALRSLREWSGMYPSLAQGEGQVEKLWTFSGARQKGVATRFAQAMFAVARAHGLHTLHTHIAVTNAAALQWADRTGWMRDGTITRYTFDLPGLRRRGLAICVHRTA